MLYFPREEVFCMYAIFIPSVAGPYRCLLSYNHKTSQLDGKEWQTTPHTGRIISQLWRVTKNDYTQFIVY